MIYQNLLFIKGYALLKLKNKYFDLNPLSSGCRNYHMPKGSNNSNFEFNFCRNIETNCNNTEGLLVDRENCKIYAGDKSKDKTFELVEIIGKKLLLRIKLGEGDICSTSKGQVKRYQTVLEVQCDEQEKFAKIDNPNEFNPERCDNIIQIRSKYGCSQGSYYAWWDNFGVTKEVVAAVLISLGVFLMIFGEKCYLLNMIMILGLFCGIFLYSLCSKFLNIHISVYFAIGAVLGILIVMIQKLIVTMVGIIIGFVGGNVVYNIVIKHVSYDPEITFWVIMIAFMILGAILTTLIEKFVILIATSLIGSYFIVRGVSIFIGKFPDESYIILLLQKHEYKQMSYAFGPTIYIYLSAILGLFLLGFLIQCRNVSDGKKNEENNNVDKPLS